MHDNKTTAQLIRLAGGKIGEALWVAKVLPHQDWDYKNNENTIFGVAWKYDQETKSSTQFDDGKYTFTNAADFGNYNAGFTGTTAGIPRREQYRWAGMGELAKLPPDAGKRIKELATGTAPYGDQPIDFKWNTAGMDDADRK